ncbi:hypothetical protein EKD16_00300 [Streptomonospora litoralis]|uniref:Uncharacterized protein n=1 Tax=Streptomonospora litoralis TaxID=2498135 RepID=A0A4P6PUW3_9ACTN|nr:hypothetical protein EKD16_00300 [Streptomonospora litoralis]
MPTYHFRIALTLTPSEEARYRAMHGLDDDDPSTRDHLAGVIHEELLGAGTEDGWWSDVRVT